MNVTGQNFCQAWIVARDDVSEDLWTIRILPEGGIHLLYRVKYATFAFTISRSTSKGA